MFEVYFQVFYPLWMEDILKTLQINHWLSLFTIGCPLWAIIGNLMFEVCFAAPSTTTVCPCLPNQSHVCLTLLDILRRIIEGNTEAFNVYRSAFVVSEIAAKYLICGSLRVVFWFFANFLWIT